jgi:hypothetical protein
MQKMMLVSVSLLGAPSPHAELPKMGSILASRSQPNHKATRFSTAATRKIEVVYSGIGFESQIKLEPYSERAQAPNIGENAKSDRRLVLCLGNKRT